MLDEDEDDEEEKKIGPHPDASTTLIFTNSQNNGKILTINSMFVWCYVSDHGSAWHVMHAYICDNTLANTGAMQLNLVKTLMVIYIRRVFCW